MIDLLSQWNVACCTIARSDPLVHAWLVYFAGNSWSLLAQLENSVVNPKLHLKLVVYYSYKLGVCHSLLAPLLANINMFYKPMTFCKILSTFFHSDYHFTTWFITKWECYTSTLFCLIQVCPCLENKHQLNTPVLSRVIVSTKPKLLQKSVVMLTFNSSSITSNFLVHINYGTKIITCTINQKPILIWNTFFHNVV